MDSRWLAHWLAGERTRWWLVGGWAIDAFLGHETRMHSDLDGGVLTALRGVLPGTSVNTLWCRQASDRPWELEPTIRRKLHDAVRRGRDGIEYLAPEIQLLYKSKSRRPKDHPCNRQ